MILLISNNKLNLGIWGIIDNYKEAYRIFKHNY